VKLAFLGATGTVTGSRYLVEHQGVKILVDCGLFQGLKELRLRNWERPPFNPAEINAVLLTHAHLDHSGAIPLLVRQGFKGRIYCSHATLDLCSILLPDSGYLQEEDAARANRHGYTKHNPAQPLYTQKDAEQALQQFEAVEFGKDYPLEDGLHFTLARAGHILGAAQIRISDQRISVLFSGDIGRLNDPVMKAPEQPLAADYIVIESTYGDRLHEKSDPLDTIGRVIKETTERGGTVIIPAFAVGRAQSILYYIHQLKAQGRIRRVPVYLDSPMAIDASSLLCKYGSDHRLAPKLCSDVSRAATYIHTVEESKKIDHAIMPSVIISASGMATGGRILHHLKHFIGDTRNTILFAGYQAEGTRGDRLVRGEKEIKIHGSFWPVRATIENLSNLSAHADYEELLQWLKMAPQRPKGVFVTHGSTPAAQSLKEKIERQLGWRTRVPAYRHMETLS
jgi:metallo-beta-lactamase family protein